MSRRSGVELAESRRARVRFAILGVLLLAGTVVVSVTVHDRERIGATADGRASVERAVATGDAALRDAVREASVAAAKRPVTRPANTPAGRALSDETPFRDALRLRIYAAARERFAAVSERVGRARTSLSLARPQGTEGLREAKRSVDLDRVEGGLEVTVDDVVVRTYREDRLVTKERRSLTVVVETPVLSLHESVAEFERRLGRGPTDGPGLGNRLTGWLYALGWGRGYAQYGGAPITNVLGTRHLALATNAGALAIQRSVFGAADADGLAAQRRASRSCVPTRTLAGVNAPPGWGAQILRGDRDEPVPSLGTPNTDAPGPDDEMTVRVGESADVAFDAFLDDYEAVLERGYRARARLSTEVQVVRREEPVAAVPPGGGWTRADTERSRTVRVTDAEGASADVPDDHERFAGYVREVRTTHRLRTTWERGNDTRVTWSNRTTVHRVGVSVSGRPSPGDGLGDKPIVPLYDTGGPLDGPNLRDVPGTAVRRLIDERDGVDEIAREAVADGPDSVVILIDADRPDGLADWIYRDLAGLREEVREVTATVQRGRLGTSATPPAELAEAIRERRADLVDEPEFFRGIAERTRVAARHAYLDAVIERLEAEAETSERQQSQLREFLDDRDLVPGGGIEGLLDARGGDRPDPRPTVERFDGRTTVTVDGDPAYLTAVGVEGRFVPGVGGEYHGLATKNRNLFAKPYGDAADAIVDGLVDDVDRASLDPAARTLRTANATSRQATDEELRERRAELVGTVEESMAVIVDRTADGIEARTSLDTAAATRAVETGLARYDSLDARALAVTNGSAADPIGAAVAEEADADTFRLRDRYRLIARASLRAAMQVSAARPEETPVERTGTAAERIARTKLQRAIGDGLRNYNEAYREGLLGEDHPAAVPRGLPVTPIPGYWYGTINAWTVDVRGEYARFAVSAPLGDADRPAGRITYVRDGRAAQFDVDGDGQSELLGWSERVSFRVRTLVAVAVPPGKTGVGDDTAVETSAGWPCPGVADGECDSANASTVAVDGMFHEQRRDVAGMAPSDLRAEYDADLAATVEAVGVETAADRSGVDRATVAALVAGDRPDLSLPDAAAVAALDDDRPDAETVEEMACEHLLLGMSTGVMDVDALATEVDLDLDPKELQQKLERRAPMRFDEFVHIQHAIARRQP